MNESDIQQLMAQMRNTQGGDKLSDQDIYNFLHANNFGDAADKNIHLFSDVKPRTEDKSIAAQQNTATTPFQQVATAIKENPEYSIPAAAIGAGYFGYQAAKKSETIKQGASSLASRLLSNSSQQPANIPENSSNVSVAEKPINYEIPAVQRKQLQVASDVAAQQGFGPHNVVLPTDLPPVKPTAGNIIGETLATNTGTSAGTSNVKQAEKQIMGQAGASVAPIIQPPAYAPAGVGVPGNVPPPIGGPIATAVETGGSITNAIQKDIAPLVDGTSEMKPSYNKNKSNPIGPGAYNWLAGQEGPKAPEVWQNIVGNKNIPYAEFMEKNKPIYDAYIGSYGEPDPFKQAAKPGEYKAPSMIPKAIKGSVAPGALAATAALATIPALASAGYQSYKGNKEAVDAELKDAWGSLKSAFTWPVDVAKAAGKGDFGPLKDALMSMNPATLMMNESAKQDEQTIKRMIQAEKVGAGRGIAPPSAYQR